jgi:hypothetical protein
MAPVRLVRIAVLLYFAACLAGCDPKTAAPVEPMLARDTLQRVLDGWKSGEKPEDFQKQEPPVVVQDVEWMTGSALVSYKLLSPGDPLDANLHCPVRLVTRDPAGKESTKDVTYIVGTDPVLTVFRQIF